jgi:hypothetical protein
VLSAFLAALLLQLPVAEEERVLILLAPHGPEGFREDELRRAVETYLSDAFPTEVKPYAGDESAEALMPFARAQGATRLLRVTWMGTALTVWSVERTDKPEFRAQFSLQFLPGPEFYRLFALKTRSVLVAGRLNRESTEVQQSVAPPPPVSETKPEPRLRLLVAPSGAVLDGDWFYGLGAHLSWPHGAWVQGVALGYRGRPGAVHLGKLSVFVERRLLSSAHWELSLGGEAGALGTYTRTASAETWGGQPLAGISAQAFRQLGSRWSIGVAPAFDVLFHNADGSRVEVSWMMAIELAIAVHL